MKKLDVPKIEPIIVKQYEFKQSLKHKQTNYHSGQLLLVPHKGAKGY